MENKFSSHSKIYSSYLNPEANLSTYKTQNNQLYVLQVEAFKNGYNLTSFPKDTYDVFQASVLSWLGAGSLTIIFKLFRSFFKAFSILFIVVLVFRCEQQLAHLVSSSIIWSGGNFNYP